MKILIADRFEPQGIQQLQDLGCRVTADSGLRGPALVRAVRDTGCQVLIVRSTPVSEAVANASGSLGLIVRAGAGVNTIDVEAASKRSIFVANCPGRNAVAVAELTLGLILALDRRIPDNVRDLRDGVWAKKEYSKARGLKGRTLGLLGVGQIGAAVARRARAFEMHVVGWSRSLTSQRAAQLGMVRLDLPEEVAASCDILSVHLAATPETSRLVGKSILDELRPGAFFVNTARAEVVDYDALAAAVRDRDLRVGLDVFPAEPAAAAQVYDGPLRDWPGVVYGTHHIGASTEQAQLAVTAETVAIVREYLHTGQVRNCVNLARGRTPQGLLVVRHRNRPGVLAHVLGELSAAGINVRDMENVLTSGEAGACAQIRLDSRPSTEVLERVERSDDNILSVSLTTPRGA